MSRDIDASKVVISTVRGTPAGEGTPAGPTVEDRVAAVEAENAALRAKLVERDVLTVEDIAAVKPADTVEVKRR